MICLVPRRGRVRNDYQQIRERWTGPIGGRRFRAILKGDLLLSTQPRCSVALGRMSIVPTDLVLGAEKRQHFIAWSWRPLPSPNVRWQRPRMRGPGTSPASAKPDHLFVPLHRQCRLAFAQVANDEQRISRAEPDSLFEEKGKKRQAFPRLGQVGRYAARISRTWRTAC